MGIASYYPHGSVLPGMSTTSTANMFANGSPYKYGYQGQFAEKDNETNETFFDLRNYNPLLGRFNNTDPYQQYHSFYMAMGNDPMNMIDPDGGFSTPGMVIGMVVGGVTGGYIGWQLNKGDYSFEEQAAWIFGGALAGGLIGGYNNEISSFFKGLKNSKLIKGII